MTRSGDRRHLIWLALGVLVPGAVLLAFGSLLVMQETELERRRAADAEALWSRSVADSLQRGLEHALAGISWDGEARRYPADTPLLSLGAVVQGRYEPVRPAPPDAWGDRGFDRMQRQTDRQFAQRNFSGALEAFRRQLGRETDSTRIAMLHHLTARAAFAIGDTATAVEAATKALETPAHRTDQFGLPIAFFSAELLVLQGLAELEVCDVLGRSLAGMAWIIGNWHIMSVRRLAHLLRGQVPSSVVIDAQNALDVGQHTQVVPDLMVLPEASLLWERPVAGHECLLLIEVADSSLEADRTTKTATYAAAEVPEYWIVDLAGRATEVYRDPSAGGYASRTTHGTAAVILAVLVPGLAVPVADVVPPEGSGNARTPGSK